MTQLCAFEPIKSCADYENSWKQQCDQYKDEGYSSCAEHRDEGYSECCDWVPCSWVCDAWVWISNVVCVLWVWIKNVVCVVWHWIKTRFCRVFYWFIRFVCKLVASIVSWVIRRIVLRIITIPCKLGTPDLHPKIKHIFVLVLENRSFDHMLGAIPINGTSAVTGTPTQTLRRPTTASNDVKDGAGKLFKTCIVDTGQSLSVGADPGHEFGNTLLALCGEKGSKSYPPYPPVDNSGYAQNFFDGEPHKDPELVMRSYTEDQVPVISALAKEFVICDHWFSSMPGPTWPNRFFYHAASSAGLDDSPSTGDTLIDALASGIIFENGSIFDLLESENIDWAVYHGDEFPQVLALSGMDVTTTMANFHDMDEFQDDLSSDDLANYVFIEPDYGDVTGSTYKCGNSQHPIDDIAHGERLIKEVYEAIRNSRVWEQSVLFVCYDEGGCFYDHVVPGSAAPPGDSITDPENNHHGFRFNQLGARVPAIVCSPWIPKNLIDDRTYEHASVPATVERLWDLPSMTDRDAAAHDLVGLFSLSTPRYTPTTLPNAATPEAVCEDDEEPASVTTKSDLVAARAEKATLLHPVDLARAQQRHPSAITSSAAGFLLIALRRDLQHAPPNERQAIIDQVRRFETLGEADLYQRAVTAAIRDAPRMRKARTAHKRSRRPSRRKRRDPNG